MQNDVWRRILTSVAEYDGWPIFAALCVVSALVAAWIYTQTGDRQ